MERHNQIIDLMQKIPQLSEANIFYLSGIVDNCLLNEHNRKLESLMEKPSPTENAQIKQ